VGQKAIIGRNNTTHCIKPRRITPPLLMGTAPSKMIASVSSPMIPGVTWLTKTKEAPALSTDGPVLHSRILTEQNVHRLGGGELTRSALTFTSDKETYHLLLRRLSLAIAVTKLDDRIEIELVRVLENDLESALVIGSLAVFFAKGDDNLFL